MSRTRKKVEMANYRDTMDQIRHQISELAEILDTQVVGNSKTNLLDTLQQRVNQYERENAPSSKGYTKTDNKNSQLKVANKKQSGVSCKNDSNSDNFVSLLTKFITF